jgi:hypothetical protein
MVNAAWFKSYAANDQPEKIDQIVQSWDTPRRCLLLVLSNVVSRYGILPINLPIH